MEISFGNQIITFGSERLNFGTLGPAGTGAATEAGADSAAAIGNYWPSNSMVMFGVNPATIRTFGSDTLGSQLSGSPTSSDRWLLPTVYLDGATPQPIVWEVDLLGNATGRITSMAGSGDSSNLPFAYWNGTSWLQGVFGTRGASMVRSGTGASVEASTDSASGLGSPNAVGSGSVTEGQDSASATGAIRTSGSAAIVEPSDTVSGTGSIAIAGGGNAVENATDSASSSGTPVSTGTGSASELQDTASGSGSVQITQGSGATTEASADIGSGTGTVYIPGTGAAQETSQDFAVGTGTAITSGSGSVQEGPDVVQGYGSPVNSGPGNAAELSADTASATGSVVGAPLAGDGASTETSEDVAKSTGVISTAVPTPTPTPAPSISTSWIANFRAAYPEFSSTTKFPSSQIDYWREVAYMMLNAARWGRQLDMAAYLFVAHNIAVEARLQGEARNGGIPGFRVGILQSKSVDKVSGSYDINAATEQGAGFWNITIYGTRLYRLIKMFGAGPIQLGGGLASSSALQAWSGPNVTPGFTSFGG